MEILLIAIVVVVLGFLIFLNRKPKVQPEVKAAVQSVVCGDTNKDNKVEVADVKEAVTKTKPAVKKVATKTAPKKAAPAKKTAPKKAAPVKKTVAKK